jgi:hypothetical protein
LAQSERANCSDECLLLAVKQTSKPKARRSRSPVKVQNAVGGFKDAVKKAVDN